MLVELQQAPTAGVEDEPKDEPKEEPSAFGHKADDVEASLTHRHLGSCLLTHVGTVKELQSSLVELQQALAEVEDEPEEGGQAREEGQGPEADRRLPASTSASAGAVGPSGAGSGARSEAGGAEGAAALAAGRQGGGAQ